MLLDLDNTLIDRNLAFRGWAAQFLQRRALPPVDLDWLVTLDCGGHLDRPTLMRATCERYGLAEDIDVLLREYRETLIRLIDCPATHREALRGARAAGWTLCIVTNGSTVHQLAKIHRTGLAPLVDGWIVSEEAGCAKPDPRIFRLAADRCGLAAGSGWTEETWMVGDHAPADIAGARLAGLRSVWLQHGRPWPETAYAPTLTARSLPEAVRLIVASVSEPASEPVGVSG
ncbi:HAD family hydrolase [Streptacidiphilus sp. P02-A3a]|nr:HAD family hydrolase [Streptacidiphilus sp. P02-A3a]